MVREHAPSIIFMDEIGWIGSSGGESGVAALDGFEPSKNIKVIMATLVIAGNEAVDARAKEATQGASSVRTAAAQRIDFVSLGTARISMGRLLAAKADPKLVLRFVPDNGRFPRYAL
ncbi:hypothetical protein B0H11DRAFT_2246424 [Mycena galericulata]|nr:hypothetical protein B0H11DRAFT_2246424 [Mycena galericulata]